MKTILIVDDSTTMLRSIEAILSRAGYPVETASSGEDAYARLSGGLKPHLMITDLNMGAMSGIDLIERARALPQCRFTPMLMLTTESSQDKRGEAKSVGATGWIVKPVQPDALIGVVKQLLPGT